MVTVTIAATVVFAITPLDVAVARAFYHAEGTNHWPLGNMWPLSVLYRLAPFITASLLVLGLLGLLIGYLRGRETWREHGIFLIFFASSSGPA